MTVAMNQQQQPFTLLLVDDDPGVLASLEATFAAHPHYTVISAQSAWAALDALRSRSVDLLITDQRMPGMSGMQLIERAKVVSPDLVCVLLTAHADARDAITAMNSRKVHRFVTKPWDDVELVHIVSAALEELHLARENAELLAHAKRRMSVLQLMVEMSTKASAQSTYGDIVDTVTGHLERVVAQDVSATLVRAEPDRPATLTLRSRVSIDDAELQALKDEILQRYRSLSGQPLPETDVLVRVTGKTPSGSSSKSFPPSPRSPSMASPRSPSLGSKPNLVTPENGLPILSLRSRLFIPLRVDGNVAGMLAVAGRRRDAFSDDDATILDVLANQASELIHGLRAKIDSERRRMNRLVEGMADGLIMTDASGEIIVANAAARMLLDVPEAAPGQPERALTSKYLRDELAFYPFELVRGWERSGAHAVAEDVEVGGRILHSMVSPITESDGRLAGVVVVLRDVTGERDLERKKEDFVAAVSHELRTPLTAISGALDLLLHHSGALNDKQSHYLTVARNAAGRLNTTVDDLLDLARAAREGLRPNLELGTLDDVVSETLARFEAAFQLDGVQVIFKRPSEPVRMLLDAARMTQVLNNLLANALKFTPRGKRVEIEVFRMADLPEIAGVSVWNDGSHIDTDDLERIFQQYGQAQSKAGRQVKGTGLGLSISRTIVEAHHGRIWAESGAGKGARFVVTLPVQGPAETVSLSADTPQRGMPPSPGFAVAGAKIAEKIEQRVLVVDDDRSVAYALKGVLLAAGFAVDVAHSADEALAAARRTRPAAFVVDVAMPGVDGIKLIEILRHDPDTRGALILALADSEKAVRAQRAGAHAFLPKPVDSARLGQTLAHLLHARRERARILIVDSDAASRTLCSDSMRAYGYSVAEAPDAARCLQQLATFKPDLILLDVVLPDKNGFELIESLKADRATSQISVIFVSARGETRSKVRALQLGGDDYVMKPFEPLELCARVETVLRRREADGASPTTMLPGSVSIDRVVTERIGKRKPFSLCYLDLDNFKAFNDYYGYAKADGVVQQTGDLLRQVMQEHGAPSDFLGHIAGDDFVFVSDPSRVQEIAQKLIESFDSIIPLYYDKEDRERGYIEADDRYGVRRKFPIMSISVVAVTDPGGRFASHSDIAARAASLKKQAKTVAGSVFLHDDGAERATA
jgi:DNA-binding response OmpR family regulator/signal transduction histidine kinase